MSREKLHGNIEVFSDEGSIAIIKALPDVAWQPELTEKYPEWETEVKARLTDSRSGKDYFLASDSRYLDLSVESIDDVAKFTSAQKGGLALTPVVTIQGILRGRFSSDLDKYALYSHNSYGDSPATMVLYGPVFSGATELSPAGRQEFGRLIREFIF